jgi:hypothetical protein
MGYKSNGRGWGGHSTWSSPPLPRRLLLDPMTILILFIRPTLDRPPHDRRHGLSTRDNRRTNHWQQTSVNLTRLDPSQWQDILRRQREGGDIPLECALRPCRKGWCLALSLKPSKDANKLSVTRALTLTNQPFKTKTMKMTRERKLLPLRLGSARPPLTCSSCWKTESARPSPLVPVKPNLSIVPTSPPECRSVDLKVSSCSKIRFLLYL